MADNDTEYTKKFRTEWLRRRLRTLFDESAEPAEETTPTAEELLADLPLEMLAKLQTMQRAVQISEYYYEDLQPLYTLAEQRRLDFLARLLEEGKLAR